MVGVSPERVMLLEADIPDGRSVGSGTLVGPKLLLTAAHVVFGGGHPASQVRVGGIKKDMVSAEVIWPTSYRAAGDDPAQLDAALVRITDPSWVPPLETPLRWGLLTGQNPEVKCEATGFPRVLKDPDGIRDSDQISGLINPLSRRVKGRYDLKVTSSVPTPLPGEVSPWAGLSGAGVFAGGLLIAVIIVDERGGYSGDRLSAVPIHRLARDPGFAATVDSGGGGLSGPAQLESVELQGLLTPLHRRASRRRRHSLSPATLLRPEEGVVAFHGRDELTNALMQWCQDTQLPVGVRLVTGPGGQGKTRLARHLAHRLLNLLPPTGDEPGWVSGFLAVDTGDRDLAALAATDAPLLLLVDYAETRTQQLRRLLPLLWDADTSHPVRVLLLARGAGDWWSQLSRDLDGAPGEIITLRGLDPVGDRAAQFAEAVTAFASHLDESAPPDAAAAGASLAPPADIGHDRYGSPLTLHMAALTALLESRLPLDPAGARAPAEETVLRHEERYWNDTAHSGGLGLSTLSLRRLVAAATLCGARSFDDVAALASTVPGSGDLTQDQLQRLDTWLSSLYPPEPGQRWGSLQPDRLGEYLIATALPNLPGVIGALLAVTDATRRHRALTILARAMGNRSLTADTTALLTAEVGGALTNGLESLGPVAVQVITETTDPRALLAAIHDAAEHADESVLRQLVDALPTFSQSLADLAAQWTTRQVSLLRDRATAAGDPGAFANDLAAALHDQSDRLAELGRDNDALAASSEEVEIYRRLNPDHPNLSVLAGIVSGSLRDISITLNPSLAAALNNQSNRLRSLGRVEEALSAGTEAVYIYTILTQARSEEFTPLLAVAMNTFAIALGDAGENEEALAAITAAEDLYRDLAAVHPDAFTRTLAAALNTQSIQLARMGRDEEALAASVEVVDIFRELADARPDAFTGDLATALTSQSHRLASLGRGQDALDVSTEAVDILRKLVAAHPDAFTDDLAAALTARAKVLANLGRGEEALIASKEAVDVYRELAAARPDDFTGDLAAALSTRAKMLAILGRREEALTASTEALTIRRELVAARPDDFTADLAAALITHAYVQEGLGRGEEALTAIIEAGGMYRELVAARPDDFADDLAAALITQAKVLADLGRDKEALTASTEAVGTYRRLAAARRNDFTADLAEALITQANVLARLRRGKDLLNAITELTRIYRRLAGGRPDDFTPKLAVALRLEAIALKDLGRDKKALRAILEAVTMRRELAAARPNDFTADLAEALITQADVLWRLDRGKEALTAITEAVDTYRELATQQDVYVPDVAQSLVIQGLLRAEMCDFEGALCVDREAVSLYAALLSVDAPLYRDAFEEAVDNLRISLSKVGRTEMEITDELSRLPSPEGK